MQARWSLSGPWVMVVDPFSGVGGGDRLIPARRSSPRREMQPPQLPVPFGRDILSPLCVRLALSVHRVR